LSRNHPSSKNRVIMQFEPSKLAGSVIVSLDAHSDERGFFARAFCEREFEGAGLPTRFPQCNLSRNTRAGTLRGMHYQEATVREAKLVRCVRGAIYDVIIDLRADSPTRFAWIGVELTADNGRALFVPEGFAHGFVTLEDASDVFYQMSELYRPTGARGLRWNDPRFGIVWPRQPNVISERDRTYPDFDPDTFDG
jgi:dTDP-4-dehydrorhamnose 3,5-epimerase